jgi:hypothetical protein
MKKMDIRLNRIENEGDGFFVNIYFDLLVAVAVS